MMNQSHELEKILRNICFNIKIEGRKVLKDFDISSAQFDVLQLLYFKNRRKLSDISKNLGVTKSTTTGLIQRLETIDLIMKTQSDDDKRVFIVEITDEGKRIIEKVINRRTEVIMEVIKKMGKDSGIIEKLIELDKTLNEVVRGDRKK